ncbi:response regulator [candidate division KSB1 bacterium]|nr:response regulator [candidate division KSB1 bacterium]
MLVKRILAILVVFLISLSIARGNNKVLNPAGDVKAIRGLLDLRNWDFERNGIVELSGEYDFYWDELLDPSHTSSNTAISHDYISVPGVWNEKQVEAHSLPGQGVATYKLKVLLNKTKVPLAFKFLDMATAFKFYCNGKLLTEVGQVGTTRATSEPAYLPQVVEFSADTTVLDLTILVSNFHHKKGGVWEKILLGTNADIHAKREKNIFTDIFLFASIFIIGIYHIILSLMRRQAHATLYFGLCCLLISMRRLLTSEVYFLKLFPFTSWTALCRLEYLTIFLVVPIFALFFYSLYKEDFNKPIFHAILIMGIVLSLVVLFTPVRIFSYTIPTYQTYLVFSCLYGFYVLIMSIRHKREGARLLLLGFFILFITIMNDILEYSWHLHTNEIVAFGQLGFIGSLTILIAYRYSNAFRTLDLQKAELSVTNEKYRHELQERIRTEKENKDLHEKLVRAQKMETIGLLAGGVAHDLNNILSGIVSYPDLLLQDLKSGSSLHTALTTIKNSGLKAAAVVQDLLTLARRGVMNFEPVNMNFIIKEFLFSPEYFQLKETHKNIEFVTNLDDKLFNIIGSPIHLRTSINNLVLNAAEAQTSGGKVTISTQNRYIDKPMRAYEEIEEGTYVVCRIEDEGAGIEPEAIKRIFEPFYTKKVMGRSGTGLGMPVVWGVVHDHKGFIDITSAPGQGTTFDLYFKMTDEELIKDEDAIPVDEYMGNGEKILIVDDVEEQRFIAGRILQRLNYTVITARSGEEAVDFLKTNEVDLLLLDMVMDPGIDGYETYKQIIRLHPHMRAVIASGYSETDLVRKAQALGAGKYIKKPYMFEKIGLAVKQELEREKI